MEEKKYLKWYNKVGYGSGDIAGNVVYSFLTSFAATLDVRLHWYVVLRFLQAGEIQQNMHGSLLHIHC